MNEPCHSGPAEGRYPNGQIPRETNLISYIYTSGYMWCEGLRSLAQLVLEISSKSKQISIQMNEPRYSGPLQGRDPNGQIPRETNLISSTLDMGRAGYASSATLCVY